MLLWGYVIGRFILFWGRKERIYEEKIFRLSFEG